jgi:hypothetical protein
MPPSSAVRRWASRRRNSFALYTSYKIRALTLPRTTGIGNNDRDMPESQASLPALDQADPRTIDLDAEHRIRCRWTPWDRRSLGLNTSELLEITYKDPAKISGLIDLYERVNRAVDIELATTRIDARDFVLKEKFSAAGFRLVETSLVLAKDSLAKHPFETNIS